jgi:uncharacterized repeat protein (TIGR01451 family)
MSLICSVCRLSRDFPVKPLLIWLYQYQHKGTRRLAPPLLLGLLLQGIGLTVHPINAQTIAPSPQNFVNRAQYSYFTPKGQEMAGQSNVIQSKVNSTLTDPGGVILGCGGKPLADYNGFSVGLYETDPTDPTGSELGSLVPLTGTELPDILDNGIPRGILPNTTNKNPFNLTNATGGYYSFLLDRTRGQLTIGKTYILVVNPSPSSTLYLQRRVKIQISNIQKIAGEEVVSYQATSLDGLPIAATGETQINQESVLIADANQLGLQLLAMRLNNSLCQSNQIQLTKSADRASAAPGDTVIYRLSVRNSSDVALNKFSISDQLPLGFKFLTQSVRGEFNQQSIPIQLTQNAQTVTLSSDVTLPTGAVFNIIYAAQLTPDALRGSGKNYANLIGRRVDNGLEVKDGPAIQQVRLSEGILTNCSTILGRVFEDRNFDGEQQEGEPGIPNAVVYLEDGNRITTDPNGLFSVKCALPGYHTGVLDPLSVPGYRLAPNRRFIEGNSASRWVRLAPGSMTRMNFAVIPAGKAEGNTP